MAWEARIMGMRINSNVEAFNAQRNLAFTATVFGKSVEKLSSGFRINRAADDAAGLSISEKLRSQIRGLAQAQRNAQDGISLVQTAEGALNEQHAILQRMRELAVHSSNGTLTDADRTQIQSEFDALSTELTRISEWTTFNGKKLLDGTLSLTLQIGSNNATAEQMTVALTTDMDATGLGLGTTSLATQGAAQTAIVTIDAAIGTVSTTRSTFGALQNRLEHTIANLSVAEENLVAAESRIRDVDMAEEMVNFTKTQILRQAGTAILAQANQAPQGVLALLR
jgi:flagellin